MIIGDWDDCPDRPALPYRLDLAAALFTVSVFFLQFGTQKSLETICESDVRAPPVLNESNSY
jgi:hypothetical protein